ncbi:hypothetical protein GCM10010398_14930 [Streptomyces fimbriatus]
MCGCRGRKAVSTRPVCSMAMGLGRLPIRNRVVVVLGLIADRFQAEGSRSSVAAPGSRGER